MAEEPVVRGAVIVYGIEASGKTRHAEWLKRQFRCTRIVDGWYDKEPLQAGDLALTILSPPYKHVGADDKVFSLEVALLF